MVKEYMKSVVLVFVLALILVSAAAMAQTPADVVADMVANSGIFPAGTSIVSVTYDDTSVAIDLSGEAITFPFGDSQAEAYADAIYGALACFEGITDVQITVANQTLGYYLPNSTQPDYAVAGGSGGNAGTTSLDGGAHVASAQSPILPPSVPSLTGELAGKLVVLHPSHGSYVYNTAQGWYRSMRTYSGPNPVTNPPPLEGLPSQPSDYYYWTMGFQWPMYYEDEMSPETIRFLYAYCQSAGAATFCSRNLDKTAGNFPPGWGGYPNKGNATAYPVPKWRAATKYNLQDIGVPESVWNEPALTAQSDKDIRARAYYSNWLMQTLGYNITNTVSFSLHSNASNTGTYVPPLPPQAQARGTETYYCNTVYPTEQARSPAFCTAVQNAVISSIRTKYDGTWAQAIYPATYQTTVPVTYPPQWNAPYGTYRGYLQTGATNTIWQDRLAKNGGTSYGEIRECKMPAQLMELLFHDDWKFYPDEAFHQDKIFRATVAWGMYTGICNYFGVTPKPYLGATIDSVSFPAYVLPNAPIAGTVSMKNQGMAWTWGNKMVGTVYSPYTVWNLQATAADQFGTAGAKIAIANDGNYYPGDTAAFAVTLTAPAETGTYTTAWIMEKDGFAGGAFGDVASAQIGVDGIAPEITITAPEDKWYNGDPITVSFSATDNMSGVDTIIANVDGTDVANGDAVSSLGSGLHTLAVTATDTVGNQATKSQLFNVDTGAPVITIVTPQATGYLQTGAIAISFSAADPYSGVASTTATMDGAAIANGASYSLLWNALGSHTLAVTSTDNVGNSGTTTVTFTIGATLESMSAAINELYGQGQIDNEGIQNSLLVKLAKYEKDVGSIADAKTYLRNFINEVEAQSGQHLTVAAANLLLTDAQYVIAHLPAE